TTFMSTLLFNGPCFLMRDSSGLTVIFFFFFSSRRRHTRWPRDWSSDVCSSDLGVWHRRHVLIAVRIVTHRGPERERDVRSGSQLDREARRWAAVTVAVAAQLRLSA